MLEIYLERVQLYTAAGGTKKVRLFFIQGRTKKLHYWKQSCIPLLCLSRISIF